MIGLDVYIFRYQPKRGEAWLRKVKRGHNKCLLYLWGRGKHLLWPTKENIHHKVFTPKTNHMKDSDIMQFGKHKGKMMGNVPADYLLWLYDSFGNKKSPYTLSLKEYIEDNMEVLKKEILESKPFYNNE